MFSLQTANDVLWLRNHNVSYCGYKKEYLNFITSQKNGESTENIHLPDFQAWARVLYEDALFAVLLAEELMPKNNKGFSS